MTVHQQVAAADRTARDIPWIAVLMVGLPALLLLARLPMLPTAHAIELALSFSDTPSSMQHHVERLLVVPIGSLIVVVFRQVLGIRSFGVFSPILIAWAFASTGPVVALGFLAAMLLLIVWAVRPTLRELRLPYASRVAVLSSTVVAVMLVPVLAHRLIAVDWLYDVSYFPVVAACLVSERFATTLSKEGARPTIVRTIVTVVQAAIIAILAGPCGAVVLLFRFPELVPVVIALTSWVGARSKHRLLERFDPRPPPPVKRAKRAKRAPQADRPGASNLPPPMWPAPPTNQEVLS